MTRLGARGCLSTCVCRSTRQCAVTPVNTCEHTRSHAHACGQRQSNANGCTHSGKTAGWAGLRLAGAWDPEGRCVVQGGSAGAPARERSSSAPRCHSHCALGAGQLLGRSSIFVRFSERRTPTQVLRPRLLSPPPPGSRARSLAPSLPLSLLPPWLAARSSRSLPTPRQSAEPEREPAREPERAAAQKAAGPGPVPVPERAESPPAPLGPLSRRGAQSSMRGSCPPAPALAPAPLRRTPGLDPGPSGRGGGGRSRPARGTEPGSGSPRHSS